MLLYIIPIIILSAYYFAFVGYKLIGFPLIYIAIYIVFALYLGSLIIHLWKSCTKYLTFIPKQPKLFFKNEKYKAHLTVIFTYAIITHLAVGHLKSKTIAILTNEFLIQMLIFAFVDCIICLIILLPLFNQSSKVDYKLIYENDIIDSTLLKQITNNQDLILEYYLNESTSIYRTADFNYRILRHSEGNEAVRYTVYEVIEKPEI